jgi:hypothetical protein
MVAIVVIVVVAAIGGEVEPSRASRSRCMSSRLGGRHLLSRGSRRTRCPRAMVGGMAFVPASHSMVLAPGRRADGGECHVIHAIHPGVGTGAVAPFQG